MKIMIVIIGILTIFAGILPFFANFKVLPASIPTSGPIYLGIIILIGMIVRMKKFTVPVQIQNGMVIIINYGLL
jgi:hypothetical protein